MKNDVFLGLGSNLGDRGANLQTALVDLEQWDVRVLRTSSIYTTEPILLKPASSLRSEPFGKKNQPDFYNMVVQVSTSRTPEDLLMVILAIERSLGRERKEKWGPRTMDIDILFYGDLVMKTAEVNFESASQSSPELIIPHPHIEKRKFVLIPLAEIAPDFVHPGLHKSIEVLLKECKDTGKVALLS